MRQYSNAARSNGTWWALWLVLAALALLACRGEQSDRTPEITISPAATSNQVPAGAPDATAVPGEAPRAVSDSDSTPLAQEETLYRAIWAGTIEEVRSLVAAGADVNARDGDGDPLLHTAVWRAEPEKVQILVDAGADVDARDSVSNPVLYTAVWRGGCRSLFWRSCW